METFIITLLASCVGLLAGGAVLLWLLERVRSRAERDIRDDDHDPWTTR